MKKKQSLCIALILQGLCVSFVTAQISRTNQNTPGISVLTPDRVMFYVGKQNQPGWEPNATALGEGTLALSANAELPGDYVGVTEQTLIAFFSEDGTVTEATGFFQDNGDPWDVPQDVTTHLYPNNPPHIAGDKREGRTVYLLGNECTPWAFVSEFPALASSGYVYDSQVPAFQLLQRGQSGPQPLAPLFEPVYGSANEGNQSGKPILLRGETRGLSNGNFAVVVEDWTGDTVAANPAALATIVDGQEGSATLGEVIIGPFNANQGMDPAASTGIWSNMAAFDGGFAIRPHTGTEDASGYLTIGFWDNDANPLGTWPAIVRTDPASPLAPAGGYTTSISILSGTATRIDSDIRSNYVHMAGRGVDGTGDPDGGVYVTKIDARTRTTVDEVYVTDDMTVSPERVTVCSDKEDNVFVCWSDTSNTGNPQIAGRLFDADLEPLTDAFLVFENSEISGDGSKGFSVHLPSCAMVDNRILVTASVHKFSVPLQLSTNDSLAVQIRYSEETDPTPTPTSTKTPVPTATSTQPPELTPTINPRSDIDNSGSVDANDLLILMQDWQKVTGEE